MHTKKVTFGEDLTIEWRRSGRRFSDIVTACQRVHPAARSTYERLMTFDDVPAKPRWRQRLYVLCLALAIDPAQYGLGDDDRLPVWPDDDAMRTLLEQQLSQTGWDDHSPWQPLRLVA